MEKKMERPIFRLELDALKVRNRDDRTYLADAFFPDVRTAKYSKKVIRVGTILGDEDYLYEKSECKVFSLDISTSDITLFVALRGFGKTLSLRSLVCRSFKSGFACVYFDIKDEAKSNNLKIQESLLKKGRLAKDEQPEAIPTTMCVPYFLKKTYKTNVQDYIFFQFSLSDITEDDLLYVLKPSNENYKNAISLAFGLIRKKKIRTLEQLKAFLLEKVNPQTARSVGLSIDNLIENKIFGDEYPLDILNILNTSVMAFVIKNYEQFDKTGGFVHLYASMLLYKIIEMRKEGEEILKKEVDVYIDEFPFFCPRNSETYSKKAILEMINKYRKRGFSGKFCIQNLSQIPADAILTSIRHIFIPSTITSGRSGKDGEMEEILKTFNIWQYRWNERAIWHDIICNAKKNKHTWMYVDTKKSTNISLMRFYLPLCAHEEESRN